MYKSIMWISLIGIIISIISYDKTGAEETLIGLGVLMAVFLPCVIVYILEILNKDADHENDGEVKDE